MVISNPNIAKPSQVPTSREVLTHCFENVLELDSEEMAMVGAAGFKNFSVFKVVSYGTVESLRDKDKITVSLWQELSDFRMYIDAVDNPEYGWVTGMTAQTWAIMDIMTLCLNHISISSAISATPKASINTTTVNLSNMETINFLKYVSFMLTDKSQFLSFYDNLVTQAAGFNIFLQPSNEVTRAKGVIPDYMDPDAESATATALYTKFRQIDSIAKEYSAAHNFLATTTSGFEFLQLIMHLAHPLLTINNIATIYIPKYSTFNDIYRYAREIGHYIYNHALKQREFSVREVSHIFLSHLDNEHNASAINKCEAAI